MLLIHESQAQLASSDLQPTSTMDKVLSMLPTAPDIDTVIDILESVQSSLGSYEENRYAADRIQKAIDILMPARSDKIQEYWNSLNT